METAKIDAYIDGLVSRSTPECTAWNLEKIREGKKASWNYIDGCMLNALIEIGHIKNRPDYIDFVESVADYFVCEDGSIRTFDPASQNLDDINEGRILFEMYRRTGKEKYRLAADYLYQQLQEHPRTPEGNFWHKKIYPNQIWLDGLYMAQPFLALYEMNFGSRDCSDTVNQVKNVHRLMRDSENGLYYHGYDSSRSIFWADKTTGCSANLWLRSIGWFSVALADLIEIVPVGEQRETIKDIFMDLMSSAAAFSDEETGLYWQVPNMPGREGNYLETSGSCMLAYAMLKGARLGILDKEYAAKGEKTFNGIIDKYLSFHENGEIGLGGICLVAGLGPENNTRRDGSYEYYISEPVVEDDAKGVAPFILCYTEIMRK